MRKIILVSTTDIDFKFERDRQTDRLEDKSPARFVS